MSSRPPDVGSSAEALAILTRDLDEIYLAPKGRDWAISTVLDWLKDHVALLEADISAYPAHRDGYLAIQFWLNRKRLIAPAFRPIIQVKGYKHRRGATMTPDQAAIALDRQRIDLHWLHANGIETADAALLDPTDLAVWNEAAISTCVAKEYKAHKKAEILGLIPEVQYGLISLTAHTVRETRREVSRQAQAIRVQLAQKMRFGKYQAIKNPGRIVDVWAAIQIATHAGCGSPPPVATVGHWYTAMTGRVLSKSQLRNALDQVGRYIDGDGPLPKLTIRRYMGATIEECDERAGVDGEIEGSLVREPVTAASVDRSIVAETSVSAHRPDRTVASAKESFLVTPPKPLFPTVIAARAARRDFGSPLEPCSDEELATLLAELDKL